MIPLWSEIESALRGDNYQAPNQKLRDILEPYAAAFNASMQGGSYEGTANESGFAANVANAQRDAVAEQTAGANTVLSQPAQPPSDHADDATFQASAHNLLSVPKRPRRSVQPPPFISTTQDSQDVIKAEGPEAALAAFQELLISRKSNEVHSLHSRLETVPIPAGKY